MEELESNRHSGLRKFFALLSLYATVEATYRAEYFIYIIGGVQPLIMLFIWITLNNSGALQGDYSSTHFICYFLLIYAVRHINVMWFPWALDDEIRQGDLSFKLLRPVHPYWNYLAYSLSDSVIRVPIMLPLVLIGLFATGAYTKISLHHLPLGLLALIGGMAIHFYANFLMGVSAFWIERARAFDVMYYTLLLLLGGAIVPVELFPGNIGEVVRFTPFPYILGFPVDIAMGSLSSAEVLTGFIIQASWIAIIGLSGRQLWKSGTKNYTGAGA